MRLLRIPALLLSALALAACEIPFPVENISEPALYVQYLASPGFGSKVMVAYASPAFSQEAAADALADMSNLSLRISLNGEPVLIPEEPQRTGNYMIFGPLAPLKAGGRLELGASLPGCPEVLARTEIPSPPAVESVTMTPAGDEEELLKVNVRLAGAPLEDSRFALRVIVRRTDRYSITLPDGTESEKEFSGTFYETPEQIASTADLASLDLDAFASVNYEEGGFIGRGGGGMLNLLTDKQFNGAEYSFYIDRHDYQAGPEQEPEAGAKITHLGGETLYSIVLYLLSEEAYNFCKAAYLTNFNMLSNFGVTPPNFTYTNVKGGLGVVGALSGAVSGPITAPR